MLLLYTPQVASRIPFFHLRKSFQQSLLLLFFAAFGSFSAGAQTDMQGLLTERAARIEASLPTKDIDLQIYNLGGRPASVIHYETLENGTIRMEFPIFLPVTEDRTERVIQRLTATYPYLSDMDFYLEQDKVVCLLAAGTTESQMEEITNHFGYIGHETAH